MRLIATILVLLLLNYDMTAQEFDQVIIVNSAEELAEQLENVTNKEEVTRLFILVKDNIRSWQVVPIWNGRYQYDNQPHNYDNPIAELPVVIEQFKNLQYLDVSNLGLSGLGTSISKLKKLETLNISYNTINLEKEINKLRELTLLKTLVAFGCDVSEYSVTLLKDQEQPVQLVYRISEYLSEKNTYFDWRKQYIGPDRREAIINELLPKIHQYYPIGYPYVKKEYKGYQELKQTLKIQATEQIENYKQSKWFLFVEDVRVKFPESIINDIPDMAFPSRMISIKLEEKETSELRKTKLLFLYKSSLTNHYTIFIKTSIRYMDYKPLIANKIISGEKNASAKEKELFQGLKEAMNVNYPEYVFVDHVLLMNTMIEGGIPIGEEIEGSPKRHSIFSYLFGQMPYGEPHIVE